ncbi:hypothetical protein GCM10025868_13560 [Angustibacter aerolatus]|uniref:AB hydrolase-1 domain-containing protein n=1 Tax=Angustibacter aerolatus TaxID=1162965 RepID=A0ABQ6JH63_9ACTN|nr:alpha/beta fold hydrolase [Angustibacter aerolatus]GMA86106.1 hypothetical protein GCM10025868_13560 [Angustibacter aerolatus]
MAHVGDAAQLPRREGTMRREALGTTVETWYQVVGDLDAGLPPLLVVHGGPGATHDYLLAMADLAGDGRAVVFYDQVGNGRSTHLPDLDPALWTVQAVRRRAWPPWCATSGCTSAGSTCSVSRGAACSAPSTCSTTPRAACCRSPWPTARRPSSLWLQACGRLREGLDPDVQAALQRHEDAGTTDSPEYQEAMKVFYDRHVCRVLPNPPEVAATFAAIESDPTVYMAMNGPSEFHVIGSLVGWSLIDRLHRVPVPTLVLAGEHDEAQPEVWEPFTALIPQVRSHVVAGASHMPHVEQPQEFLDVVSTFLRDTDPRSFSRLGRLPRLRSPERVSPCTHTVPRRHLAVTVCSVSLGVVDAHDRRARRPLPGRGAVPRHHGLRVAAPACRRRPRAGAPAARGFGLDALRRRRGRRRRPAGAGALG